MVAATKAKKPAVTPAKGAKPAKAAPKPAKAKKPAPKRTAGALGKAVKPSPELAAIIGHHALPRTDVVAKLWKHIHAHSLQDPADKRTIVADDKLRPIIGDRCTMFELNKLLSPHLTAA